MRRVLAFLTCLLLLPSDGRSVVAADPVHHTLRYLTSSGYPETFQTMTFSPDSNQLAVSVAGKVQLYRREDRSGNWRVQLLTLRHSILEGWRGIHFIGTNQSLLIDTLTGDKVRFNSAVTPGYVGLFSKNKVASC